MPKNMLEGFEFVASDAVPALTLDNQRRFYINTSARRLLDIKPYQRIAIAYNSDNREIAIVRPRGYEAPISADIMTSNYNVDKRYYMSARHFSKQYGYTTSQAPYTFVYERGASDGSVFIFRLLTE